MLAIVSAMAGTMLCNAPGVRRERGFIDHFIYNSQNGCCLYSSSQPRPPPHSEQSNSENLGYF